MFINKYILHDVNTPCKKSKTHFQRKIEDLSIYSNMIIPELKCFLR
jgi:hypothetical protein